MKEDLYLVKDNFGNIVAKEMDIEVAITLVKALFDKYYLERDIAYMIVRMVDEERIVDEERTVDEELENEK